MGENVMSSFWDDSWRKIDTARLNQYVNAFDLNPDRIIESLQSKHVRTVCDAGCGCGIYSLKLLSNGFSVSGFDVSDYAVNAAKQLLKGASLTADIKTASILSTGYEENQFDAVVARDVIDHLPKKDGAAAIYELYRITRSGGIIFITLDHLDDEYETEAHAVNGDGDLVFTDGKWKGMVFHPYSEREIFQMIPSDAVCEVADSEEGMIVKLMKAVNAN